MPREQLHGTHPWSCAGEMNNPVLKYIPSNDIWMMLVENTVKHIAPKTPTSVPMG